jgi:hypothetical protein
MWKLSAIKIPDPNKWLIPFGLRSAREFESDFEIQFDYRFVERQGDQSGRIFAYWAIVRLGEFSLIGWLGEFSLIGRFSDWANFRLLCDCLIGRIFAYWANFRLLGDFQIGRIFAYWAIGQIFAFLGDCQIGLIFSLRFVWLFTLGSLWKWGK